MREIEADTDVYLKLRVVRYKATEKGEERYITEEKIRIYRVKHPSNSYNTKCAKERKRLFQIIEEKRLETPFDAICKYQFSTIGFHLQDLIDVLRTQENVAALFDGKVFEEVLKKTMDDLEMPKTIFPIVPREGSKNKNNSNNNADKNNDNNKEEKETEEKHGNHERRYFIPYPLLPFIFASFGDLIKKHNNVASIHTRLIESIAIRNERWAEPNSIDTDYFRLYKMNFIRVTNGEMMYIPQVIKNQQIIIDSNVFYKSEITQISKDLEEYKKREKVSNDNTKLNTTAIEYIEVEINNLHADASSKDEKIKQLEFALHNLSQEKDEKIEAQNKRIKILESERKRDLRDLERLKRKYEESSMNYETMAKRLFKLEMERVVRTSEVQKPIDSGYEHMVESMENDAIEESIEEKGEAEEENGSGNDTQQSEEE